MLGATNNLDSPEGRDARIGRSQGLESSGARGRDSSEQGDDGSLVKNLGEVYFCNL